MERSEEKPIETSGAGAFSGMITGGALGLPFAPFGVIIGGFGGALIGDELERQIQKRKEKEE